MMLRIFQDITLKDTIMRISELIIELSKLNPDFIVRREEGDTLSDIIEGPNVIWLLFYGKE
jgi:hypothetical protein